MLIVYHGTGSQSLQLVGQSIPDNEIKDILINVRRVLKARNYDQSQKLFDSIPFTVMDGTNDFGDEFFTLYAKVPLLKYEEAKATYNYPEVKNAYRQIAEVTSEIGPYIRFIALDLLLSKSDEWDVFVCHASKDKNSIARPLADLLETHGLRVWIDENELRLGDGLQTTIDKALSKSKYGVVVLSKAFFERDWPQRELNALASLESPLRKVILPIWHEVDHEFIAQYSPMLAGKIGVSSGKGLVHVAAEVLKAIQPEIKHAHSARPTTENVPETSIQDRYESIKAVILAETLAIKEKAQRYLDGKSSLEELKASTPMLTSIAAELRYLHPDQIIAYRRAVTLDMEMRQTGNREKLIAAIEVCDDLIDSLHGSQSE